MAFIFPIGLGGGFYAPARANTCLRSLPITCGDKKTPQHTKSSHKKKCCGIEVINNSDCKILLDQRKYMTKFDGIQAMLGLSEKEKSQILSINQNNDPNRLYKEVWIGLGGMQSAVYATEVSMEEYLTYTTEETEKVEVMNRAAQLGGDIETAIRQLAIEKRNNKKK